MREVTQGVYQISGFVPHLINTWLIETSQGDVLIDAGTRWMARRLLHELRERKVTMIALTHVHPDHQGSTHAICKRLHIPLACHEIDAEVMEGKAPMMPNNWLVGFVGAMLTGPTHPVTTRWKDGDMLGEWRIRHLPGHTMGHVIYFRERDRVAVVGDVVRNASIRGGFGRLAETPHVFSADPQENRRSMRKLLDLQPELLCCGHGPATRKIDELKRLVDRLG